MFDDDAEPPTPPLAMDEAGIRAERERDSGPVTRRRDQLDAGATAFWAMLSDRVRGGEAAAYAAGVRHGGARGGDRRRAGRGDSAPSADFAAAPVGAAPRVQLHDIYRVFAAVVGEAEEFGRTLAGAVRDVFDAWEAGQSARQRMEAPRVDDLISDGAAIWMGDECLVTRPVAAPADEPAPAWPRPVLLNPKPWPRRTLEWRVRDELERLLHTHEVPFARARGDRPLPRPASADDLHRTYDAGACVRHLAARGEYAALGAELVEAFVLGQHVRYVDHGLFSATGPWGISTARYLLAAWHRDIKGTADDRRVLLSTRAYRRGSHDQHLRDAVRAAVLAWPLAIVECPTGIDAAQWGWAADTEGGIRGA